MKFPRPDKALYNHIARNLRRYLTLFLAVVLILFGICRYGAWETRQLECNYTTLPAEALPDAGPLRIAYVSDIHNNPQILQRCIEYLRSADPDVIILGGDYVTAEQRFRRTRWLVQGLRSMKEIAPVFATLGNHDYEKLEQVERVFQTADVPLLRNEARCWDTPAGRTLCIVGLGDWNEGDEYPDTCLLDSGTEEMPVLLVSHDPESRWLLRGYDWNLMLSGHTHGGQLGIPFTSPRQYVSFRSSMPAGLYDFENGKRVFVSRGAGTILGMRFFCRPEINIIDIVPASQ